MKYFKCSNCGLVIEVQQGVPKPPNWPKCGASATVINRLDKGAPGGRRGGGLPWQRFPP